MSANQKPKTINDKSNSTKLIKEVSIVIILIVVIIAAFYFIYSSGLLELNNPVVGTLAMHKPINLTTLTSILANFVNKTKQLNISYNGTLTLSSVSQITGNIKTSIPMKIEYEKYYNLSRTTLNFNDVPMLENMSLVEISNKSKQYLCIKSSSSFTGNSGFQCQSAASNQTLSASLINMILKKTNLNITVNGVNEASYQGLSCYIIKGNGVIKIPYNLTSEFSISQSITQQKLNYSINGCVSTQFGLPLNLSVALSTNATKILITLEVTNLNYNTNPTIAKLPGPIENGSSTAPSTPPSQTVPSRPASPIENVSTSPESVAPFQQMINITESDFSGLQYNSNFADFEYTYANGTVIPAWIERNDSG
ncbi:MAG: hypothetical protein ACP5UN_03445, partial [Candidatus Micrarchaeia archaeon]